jgi:hypothetical protein
MNEQELEEVTRAVEAGIQRAVTQFVYSLKKWGVVIAWLIFYFWEMIFVGAEQ